VRAASAVGNSECSGDNLGSRDLVFHPGKTEPGSYSFDVGSAGSATLVLQTVLPPLLATNAKSAISVTEGTHNTFAPPFDFFAHTFSALLARIGIRIDSSIERYGFYPAGGGRITSSISRQDGNDPFVLVEQGKLVNAKVRAIVSNLPAEIAAAEAQLVIEELDAEEIESSIEKAASNGPGNVVMIELNYENVTEIFTGFGEKGKHRDEVAREAIDEANEYIDSGVPVGQHLADQLLIPSRFHAAADS
jgi:RNA 3'-terminal phosphate cyclase (ATP)